MALHPDPNSYLCGVSTLFKNFNFVNIRPTILPLDNMPDDFITTIDSDDEGSVHEQAGKKPQTDKDDFDPDFDFDFGGGGKDNGLNSWEVEQANEVQKVSISHRIVLRKDSRCRRYHC